MLRKHKMKINEGKLVFDLKDTLLKAISNAQKPITFRRICLQSTSYEQKCLIFFLVRDFLLGAFKNHKSQNSVLLTTFLLPCVTSSVYFKLRDHNASPLLTEKGYFCREFHLFSKFSLFILYYICAAVLKSCRHSFLDGSFSFARVWTILFVL